MKRQILAHKFSPQTQKSEILAIRAILTTATKTLEKCSETERNITKQNHFDKLYDDLIYYGL